MLNKFWHVVAIPNPGVERVTHPGVVPGTHFPLSLLASQTPHGAECEEGGQRGPITAVLMSGTPVLSSLGMMEIELRLVSPPHLSIVPQLQDSLTALNLQLCLCLLKHCFRENNW